MDRKRINCNKFHCCLHTVSALAAKHSRDITLSVEAAVKFCMISRASLLWQGNEAQHMPRFDGQWLMFFINISFSLSGFM